MKSKKKSYFKEAVRLLVFHLKIKKEIFAVDKKST